MRLEAFTGITLPLFLLRLTTGLTEGIQGKLENHLEQLLALYACLIESERIQGKQCSTYSTKHALIIWLIHLSGLSFPA